jgi:ABC-type multidrug transport system permease subunit
VLLRFRWLFREPGTLFFIFLFPLLITTALGIAFQNKGPPQLSIAVVEGPGVDSLVAGLNAAEALHAIRCSATEGESLLRRGRAAVMLVPGTPPELLVDPSQPDSLSARLMVVDALERMNGRKDTMEIKQGRTTAPGARYVDFLVPGLMAYGLMNSAIWGFSFTIVRMREGKLLKRLATTPMSRVHFLLSFLVSRVGLALLEIGLITTAARLFFGIHVEGSLFTVVGFGVGGALAFTALSFLAASRASNIDTATGVVNLIAMPMTLLSGVFFPASRFPDAIQPLINALPLTALINGLRAIILDGASAASLGTESAILFAWGLGSFLLAIKFFRWS